MFRGYNAIIDNDDGSWSNSTRGFHAWRKQSSDPDSLISSHFTDTRLHIVVASDQAEPIARCIIVYLAATANLTHFMSETRNC